MQHKMVLIGIAVLAAGALWYGMSQTSSSTTIVTSNTAGTSNVVGGTVTAGPVDKDTQRILEILLALRAVSLDDVIFSNPSFISLKDFSTKIIPEPVGRPDPFAPLDHTIPSAQAQQAATGSVTTLSSPHSSGKLQLLPNLQSSPGQ
ncbi:hypothetical protein FJY93_03045 [Candidatus Kaiserbacteria bacterium]|nr:hypothetical protein [Candidatus Kaiserbacteria bacterium]